MSRFILSMILLVSVSAAAFAQHAQHKTHASAGAQSSTAARAAGQTLDIASGTHLVAQLENTLDVSKARVGDRVVLKTTEAIKSGGRTVVKKGARLVGTVTNVQRRAKGSAESHVTLLFDRIESGSLSAPITATINSITQARARGRMDDDSFATDAGARTDASASGRTTGGGGGLLSGTTGAVGGVLNTTTRATGDLVGGATETAGGAVNTVGRTVGQVRVTQSLDASAEGGSTLSLTGGNLRLEKGTTFHLTLSQSASVNNDK